MFFVLQHRRGRGQGRGLAGLIIGTMDAVLDSRVRLIVAVDIHWRRKVLAGGNFSLSTP